MHTYEVVAWHTDRDLGAGSGGVHLDESPRPVSLIDPRLERRPQHLEFAVECCDLGRVRHSGRDGARSVVACWPCCLGDAALDRLEPFGHVLNGLRRDRFGLSQRRIPRRLMRRVGLLDCFELLEEDVDPGVQPFGCDPVVDGEHVGQVLVVLRLAETVSHHVRCVCEDVAV